MFKSLASKMVNRPTLILAIGFVWAANGLMAESVNFQEEIQPVLKNRCSRCHSGHERKGGFSIDTRDGFIKGGESGPAVIVGQSSKSLLIDQITAEDPDDRMPSKGKPLTATQIESMRAWIDEGLSWPEGFSFTDWRRAPLAPRVVKLPKGGKSDNPIDRLVGAYWKRQNMQVSLKLVDDRAFARQASLDLIGVLPSPAQMEAFVSDSSPDKRSQLVDQLLSNNQGYAEHWLTFWSDMLRNAYQGTGYIDGGRKQITQWLYNSLHQNMSYDEFVRQLIDPVDGSEGFINGIKWRGVVTAAQRREVQASQNIGQVFLGTNLKCASCHDSFISHWQIKDVWSLASVFADEPLEIYRCGKRTGKLASPAFLYPELGDIDPKAPKNQRIAKMAKIITDPGNGRLGRTLVNRFWEALMGRGIVEPVDDMDQKPWDADLLDWLAVDFAEHGYDLKHTLRLICNSRAYQSMAVSSVGNTAEAFVFRGPLTRRMSAEQFIDALCSLTRTAPGDLAAKITKPGIDPTNLPSWIWADDKAAESAPQETVYFRKTFMLDGKPASARAVVTCDNEFVLFVNGARLAKGKEWNEPVHVDLAPHMHPGENIIAVKATNIAPSPAGLAFRVQMGSRSLMSDNSWLVNREAAKGWQQPGFKASNWRHAVVLGPGGMAPWSLAAALGQAPSTIRASLVNDDPLSRALGRPNRENVVTRRDSLATMLQALELTNGGTLDAKLKEGASHWIKAEGADPAQMVQRLYQEALGRRPSDREAQVASELLGTPVDTQAVEDLLWIVAMLPDFQLIR